MRKFVQILASLALAAACAFHAAARGGPVPVDAELVFAVDVSWSMDEGEQKLQREGYVRVPSSPEFANAIANGPQGKIAAVYMERAAGTDQKVVVPWTLIDSPAAAKAFAAALDAAPPRRARRTSIAGAIDASQARFRDIGFAGTRRVIDISGDGPNNNGRPVTAARDEALADGAIIDGLPLMIRPVRAYAMDIAERDVYDSDCVIGGPGAFMIPVLDAKDFVTATRTKLVRDIARRAPLVIKADAKAPRIPCMIGEMPWQRRNWN